MDLISCGESHNINKCVEHSHKHFEVVLVTDGNGVTVANNKEFIVSKGSVTIIPPNVLHSHYSNSVFSDMFIRIDGVKLPNEPFIFKDVTHELYLIAKMIYTNYIRKEYNYKMIIHHLIAAFYEYLIIYAGNTFKYDFVFELKSILTDNLSNSQFVISDAVKKIGVSYEYMRHCFKSETGQTPLEYITAIRIEQAKQYLSVSTYYSVSDVAFLCGFTDSLYFSRCFKKHTCISPTEYQNKYRK